MIILITINTYTSAFNEAERRENKMKNTIKDPEVIAKIYENIYSIPVDAIPSREHILGHIIDQMEANGGKLIGRLPVCVPANQKEGN